jgi:hypothetical protein
MASTTPQKKRGLSSLFGAKKSKDNKDLAPIAPLAPIGANHDLHASQRVLHRNQTLHMPVVTTHRRKETLSPMFPMQSQALMQM